MALSLEKGMPFGVIPSMRKANCMHRLLHCLFMEADSYLEP